MEKTNLHGLSKKKNHPIVILLNSDLIIQKINTTGEKVFFNKNKRALINHSFIDLLHKINIDTSEFSLALQSNNPNFYQNITFKHKVSNETYNAIVVTVGQLKEKNYILNIYLSDNYQAYLHGIINNLPGAVYWKDKEGRYLGCNTFVAKMAGYDDPEKLIGKTDYDLCWSEFAEEWQSLDNTVIQKNTTIVREEKAKLSDGKIITELTFKTPLKNEQGEIVGIIGTSLDITERKKMEEELNSAKLAAEGANLLKTNFIQNMQHDIRTPASSVWSTLNQLVESNQLPDKELLTMLRNSSKQLFSICNDVIDFDR
ncbi:MAG: PAS domain-containing protein, partial [Silvanigrellaceae bacterium]|nr:PAS domain-containing protein [Silvanigrellaceae bacterium]